MNIKEYVFNYCVFFGRVYKNQNVSAVEFKLESVL